MTRVIHMGTVLLAREQRVPGTLPTMQDMAEQLLISTLKTRIQRILATLSKYHLVKF